MTIINKSLLVTLCFLASSLSQAEEISFSKTVEESFLKKEFTLTQAAGFVCLAEGVTYYRTGWRLLKNNYDNLTLKKYFLHPQTPKGMKQYGLFTSLNGGIAIIASPFIFTKAEELGIQHRTRAENEWKEKMTSLDSLEKNQEDESNNS